MKKMKKWLSLLLVLAMVAALVPTVAMAAEGDTPAEDPLDNLVMNKTACLEDDGTYTITLDAYAKGNVSTTTVKQVVPTDVILVLDQSGSMDTSISGIPGNTYSEANPTNAQVAAGTYYYKVGDTYYKVTATKELISTSTEWVGDDGKVYTADQLSYSWQRRYDGQTYNTAHPFVTSSLKVFQRSHSGSDRVPYGFYYFNVDNTSERSGPSDTLGSHSGAAGGRYYFINGKSDSFREYPAFGLAPYTAELHNDGAPGNNTTEDDNYYCAASYIAVTQKTVNTYRYTYTYVDDSGKTVVIGTSDTMAEAALDAAACAINPLYTRDTTTGTRLEALQYAANKFIDDIRTNALANGVDHRVAVIGFASSGSNYNDEPYENTELFVGGTQYRYNGSGNKAPSAHYGEALQSVKTTGGYANLQASIDNLDNYGGTYPQYGFDMANGVFGANSADYTKNDGTTGTRSRVVIFMTDGEPGSGGNVNTTEANATISKAGIAKTTYSAKVYSVAVQNSVGTDQANFLNSVSSNGTHTLATSAEELENFFSEVSSDITSTTTTVKLSENSYVVDRLSDYFVVPEGFSVADNVTVQIAKHHGDEAFGNPVAAPAGITAALSTGSDGTVRGVTVRGFNFVSSENVVTTEVSSGGSTIANGNKLVITITGLLAKDEAATGTYVDTNNAAFSGIWDTDEDGNYGVIKAFPVPHTLLDKKAFVLDYAKDTGLDVYGATKVDSAADGLFSKVDDFSTGVSGSYGDVTTSNGLTYSPKTMNWTGFDTFYALGRDTSKGDAKTHNIWSKVSVIPANNVYYEDTFVTNNENGTVGIAYGGNWTTVGDDAGNAGAPNDGTHGWVTSLGDDAGYSDGSAHRADAGATATFTFTGTGVDVYSHTDLTTGLVLAELYNGEGTDTMAMSQFLVVDNLAQSGGEDGYYQIPTVSFSGLEHGTYTMKLTVAASSTGSIYYLDGIRVYNPLSSEQEGDDTVSGAYGDEVGAAFVTVRDILLAAEDLDGEGTVDGAVFIDYIPAEGSEGTADNATLSTYVDYGPKNEVYLAAGQAVAFRVVGEGKCAVGLKAPNGAATAQFTNGTGTSEQAIAHASDLYYVITPNADGIVEIKNTGDNLLSITKLKVSGGAAVDETSDFSVSAVMTYANAFDELPVVPYSVTPESGEPDPAGEEKPGEDGSVIIENPEEPEEPVDEEPMPVLPWLDRLLKGLKKFFGRP